MTKTKKQQKAAASKDEQRKKAAGAALVLTAGVVASMPLWLQSGGDDIGAQPKALPVPTGWYDTGDVIVTTDTTLRVYARKFPAGRVELGGNECQTSGCSMYSVVLKPNPCPADLNGDGLVNTADLAQVRMHLYGNNPAGDANSDGIVNPLDAAYIAERIYTEC